jgi:LmbE family N-acetylglucosaminyl deacetylase
VIRFFADPTLGRPPRLLFIGAHSDDIEIGCGGTVLRLLDDHPEATVKWVVLSSEGERGREAEEAARFLLSGAREPQIQIESFRGAYFPSEIRRIKDYFETLKSFQPDLIFTHPREELHQDHRVVGELTWNTFRDHAILEYEIPKYDGGLGSPSVFVPLSGPTVDSKIDLLMTAFKSQHDKTWFTPETFRALLRLRGIECNAPGGYAEAFYCRKLILGTGE